MTERVSTDRADIVVVGGGAAGLATAIFAARRLPGRAILVMDGAPKLGAKILVSGGGRCNVTNVRVTPRDFWGGNANIIKNVLAAFNEKQTIAFFHELGVGLHEEERGKLFPDSNDARTVLAALLAEAQRRGVRVLEGHRVVAIDRREEGFRVSLRSRPFASPAAGPPPGAGRPAGSSVASSRSSMEGREQIIAARRVVLATGGRSLPKTGSDGFGYELAERLGHTLVPTTPGLAPLVLDGDFHEPLSGIAHDVELILQVEGRKPLRLSGPLLWTHFGASGPVILDASRHWHRAVLEGRPVQVSINLLPGDDLTTAERRLTDLARQQPRIALSTALTSFIPSRVGEAVLRATGIPASVTLANLSREVRRKLLTALLNWPLPVRDSRGYGYAEVTAGGVALEEIDSATMRSRKCPGLYLVGEILDVDGRIGGFNFQWAWSSGFVAGAGLARDLSADEV